MYQNPAFEKWNYEEKYGIIRNKCRNFILEILYSTFAILIYKRSVL